MENLFLNRYPYTDFHELNLSWIIEMLSQVEKTLNDFVSINALKYADPIQWNITSQYEKNTIVIDPVSGVAYISVQPVPAGVALTNTDYWTVVFDLGQFVVRASKNFSIKYESDTTITATFASTANDWLVWGDTLYKALVNITPGDTYVVNGNIEHFTMEELVGHLEDLSTTDKASIVNAINELVASIGNLNTNVGDLNDLTTIDKTSIVNAINENVLTRTYLNVKLYGAVGDGITNDTQAFLDAIASMTDRSALYVPSGTYLIDPIVINKGVTIIGDNIRESKLKANSLTDSLIKFTNGGGCVQNIAFDGNNIDQNVYMLAFIGGQNYVVENVRFMNFKRGFYVDGCTHIFVNNSVWQECLANGIAITAGETGYVGACSLNNIVISSTTQFARGVELKHVDAFYISNSTILTCNIGVDICPNNTTASVIYITNSVIDTCTNCMYMRPTNSGDVRRFSMSNSYLGVATGAGVTIFPDATSLCENIIFTSNNFLAIGASGINLDGTGSIDTVEISSNTFQNCALTPLRNVIATNINVIGNDFDCDNAQYDIFMLSSSGFLSSNNFSNINGNGQIATNIVVSGNNGYYGANELQYDTVSTQIQRRSGASWIAYHDNLVIRLNAGQTEYWNGTNWIAFNFADSVIFRGNELYYWDENNAQYVLANQLNEIRYNAGNFEYWNGSAWVNATPKTTTLSITPNANGCASTGLDTSTTKVVNVYSNQGNFPITWFKANTYSEWYVRCINMDGTPVTATFNIIVDYFDV